MGNLLLDESPLVIQQGLAKKLGLNKAIVVQQLHYLLKQRKEEDRDRYFHQGKWWVYNTYADWKESFFDFWSVRTVRRIFNALEDEGIFISSSLFNQKSYDKTKWYTIDYQHLDQILKATGQSGQRGSGQTGRMQVDNLDRGSGQVDQTYTKEVSKRSTKKDTSIDRPTTIRDAFIEYWQVLTPNPVQLLKLTEVAQELTKEVVIEGMKRARYKDDPFQYCFGLNPEDGKGLINNWIKAEVSSLKDVEELDRKYKKRKEQKGGANKRRDSTKNRESKEESDSKYIDY